MASGQVPQAELLLRKQLRNLMKNPVDGFSAGLTDENNIYEWSVTVIGPPETLYEGGFFTAGLSFPRDYPQSPPICKFKSEMWHPNGMSNEPILEGSGERKKVAHPFSLSWNLFFFFFLSFPATDF